ncbi:MAG: hypothetical protein ABS76_14370 [Pelagibacterium sp. SCN 64-44]|nr:MAG: hypothetical protein ABS76_14370 [Pelagibacterium sp. SCN 64-44]
MSDHPGMFDLSTLPANHRGRIYDVEDKPLRFVPQASGEHAYYDGRKDGPGRSYIVNNGVKEPVTDAQMAVIVQGDGLWLDGYDFVYNATPIQDDGSGVQSGSGHAGGDHSQITINIGGRRVKVGDEFMQMSPEQQNAAVEEIAQSIGIQPNGGGGNKLQDFRRRYPQYDDMSDPQLADALYRKFYSDMPRSQFDAQLGLTSSRATGPSQEWLAQNPSLADLPISGNLRPPATPRPQGAQPKTGAFENATAGLNNALYSVAGFPVDAANTALRIGAAGINAVTGSDIQLPENTMGGRQSIADAFGQVGVTDPANVVPPNNFEASLRAGGEGAGYAVAPELMMAQLSKLGIVGQKAQQLMGQIFGEARSVGSTTGNMVASATGGVGAQMGADEWKGTAAIGGGLAGAGVGTLITQLPRLAGAGGRAIGDFMAPFTQGGREQMAGRQLREGATSPGAVIDAIANAPSELVPGSKSTTFQMSGDMGIGSMERGAAANNPAEFM